MGCVVKLFKERLDGYISSVPVKMEGFKEGHVDIEWDDHVSGTFAPWTHHME
jgi:hypothetical protein